jgi:hypothetical protein
LSASLDEIGKGLVKIKGDIDGVETALSNAVVTGFNFTGSLETAIVKGNALGVSIQGDAEIIQNALDAIRAVIPGVDGITRQVKKQARGYTRRVT